MHGFRYRVAIPDHKLHKFIGALTILIETDAWKSMRDVNTGVYYDFSDRTANIKKQDGIISVMGVVFRRPTFCIITTVS